MKYLVDECLSDKAAKALQALADEDETFLYIAGDVVQRGGAQDVDIPAICAADNFDVIITANVRDFGARKWLWESLLANGVHVIVLRPPGKQPLNEDLTVSILARHRRAIVRALAQATEPTLLVVTESGFRKRPLPELIAEHS